LDKQLLSSAIFPGTLVATYQTRRCHILKDDDMKFMRHEVVYGRGNTWTHFNTWNL